MPDEEGAFRPRITWAPKVETRSSIPRGSARAAARDSRAPRSSGFTPRTLEERNNYKIMGNSELRGRVQRPSAHHQREEREAYEHQRLNMTLLKRKILKSKMKLYETRNSHHGEIPNEEQEEEKRDFSMMSKATVESVGSVATMDLTKMGTRARMNDISYLQDQPSFLTPRIPETQIPQKDYVIEKLFFPTERGSTYCPEDGMWHRTLFPAAEPKGRIDSIYLDRWVTHAIQEYSSHSGHLPLSEQLTGIVPILNTAMREVVRQTLCFCEARGNLLEQVWDAYVGLFNFVLQEMQTSLERSKKKVVILERNLKRESEECELTHAQHPNDLQELICSLEEKFGTETREINEKIDVHRKVTDELIEQTDELNEFLSSKYPHCSRIIKELLELDYTITDEMDDVPTNDPMELLAIDTQRLVGALKPKDRAKIGKLLGPQISAELENLALESMEDKKASADKSMKDVAPDLGDEAFADDFEKIEFLKQQIHDQEVMIGSLTKQKEDFFKDTKDTKEP